MWIAKPLSVLTQDEKAAWSETLVRTHVQNGETPLAQTLAWGAAIEALKVQTYLVFSPNESVGGLIFSSRDPASGKQKFECINGPLLHWDDAQAVPRQLATFAMAAAKLNPQQFGSLILRPRWLEGQSAHRLPILPISPFTYSKASTLKLSLTADLEEKCFTPRLKRTLCTSEKSVTQCSWRCPKSPEILDFSIKMTAFSKLKGFSVPPVEWFTALTENSPRSLRLASVMTEATQCQLLIALHDQEAHYLFGYESRTPGTRGALSPSAIAHRLAIREARKAGMKSYDFNGYQENASGPYAGVCRFKEQFGAELIKYEVPEFRIE